MTKSNIIFFLLGIATGGAVTYYLARSRFDSEIQTIAEDAEIALRAHEEALDREYASVAASKPTKPTNTNPKTKNDEVDYDGIVDGLNYNKFSYTKSKKQLEQEKEQSEDEFEEFPGISDEEMADILEKSERKEAMAETIMSNEPVQTVMDGPYIISSDEFYGDEGYEKESYLYFEADNTFCDDEDEVVEIEDFVGIDNVLEHDSYIDGRIYIRNEDEMTDYEIIRHDYSYEGYMRGDEID